MIRKMTKTVKEWNQKNSGVQVVVVRGAGENFMSGRWLLVTAVMVVEMVMAMIMSMVKDNADGDNILTIMTPRQSFLQWGRCGLLIQRGC